jgi:hypothetical protein
MIMVPVLVCFASALAAAEPSSSVTVRGDTACPTAADLRAALVGLVAPATADAAPDTAELRARGGVVTVELANGKGDVIAKKALPASASCADRARTAAVIVAAWEAHLRGGMPGDLAVPTPPREPPLPTVPLPAVTPVPLAPAPATPPPKLRVVAPAPAPSSAPAPVAPPLEVEAGVGLFASLVSTQEAPAGLAEVVVSRRDGRFSLGLEALAVSTHSTNLDPTGRGDWRRVGGAVDGRARWRWRRFELGARAGFVLTALVVEGSALPNPASATLPDPGALVGVRGRLPLGVAAPWIDVSAAAWPRARTLYVSGTSESANIPRFELLLGVGASFGAQR